MQLTHRKKLETKKVGVPIWVCVVSSHGYTTIWVDTNTTHLINCIKPSNHDITCLTKRHDSHNSFNKHIVLASLTQNIACFNLFQHVYNTNELN